jgi:transcriptional regulator with XRE-family HTH domain
MGLKVRGSIATAKDHTGIIATLAQNVRARRKAIGLSQEALAHEATVDRTYVSQVERQQRNVPIVVLARLAKALGTTADRLLVPSAETGQRRHRRTK